MGDTGAYNNRLGHVFLALLFIKLYTSTGSMHCKNSEIHAGILNMVTAPVILITKTTVKTNMYTSWSLDYPNMT